MTPLAALRWGMALGASLASLACVNNPVHDDEVAALGPETAVPSGPLHRAGQPCVVCHGPFGPASVQFAVAGTVYRTAGAPDPAVGAFVFIEDERGATVTATTNAAGNFYVLLQDFEPKYPLRASVQSSDGSQTQTMQGYVARDGSCASCHRPEAGATSAGPVVLSRGAADAGITE